MRAVFLDRDGVLNCLVADSDGVLRPPRDPAALELLDGVEEACRLLRADGFALIVATNQPDVARGRLSRSAVEAVNESLRSRLPLDEILVCYHDDADGCSCRKPRAGLLIAAAERLGIDLMRSFMVGDRAVDIEAGQTAGCRTIFIGDARSARADHRAKSLLAATDWILDVSQGAGT